MDRIEVRVKCIEAAVGQPFSTTEQCLETAQKFYEWVMAQPPINKPSTAKKK